MHNTMPCHNKKSALDKDMSTDDILKPVYLLNSIVGVFYYVLIIYQLKSWHLISDEKPDVLYSDIGGMDIQKQEVREAVELPLTHFDLYKQIGIDPPRGVLMFGPPGCGKTMLAKAVAHHTTGTQMSSFIIVCD